MKPGIAILVGPKGRGSNMVSLARACQEGKIGAQVRCVIGAKADAPALMAARDLLLPTAVIPPSDRYAWDLLEALRGCELVCLAGYLRLLPDEVLNAFPGRVLNVHPSLLPKYGGKGMYGIRVHEAVIAAGEKESGCTVHRVTSEYDDGEILIQKRCPVLPDDTPESLAARVLKLEHEAYPEAVAKVLRDG